MSEPLMKAVGDCFSEIAKLGQKSIDYYKQECERLQAENQSLRSQIVEWRDAQNNRTYQVLGGNRQSKADARDRLIAAEQALRAALPN